ncbi:O-antigen ligase family protein [Marinobacter hydrocarbonoclasticus]|nr:O-antigen ligase family protein [Marinobacter nauticus]
MSAIKPISWMVLLPLLIYAVAKAVEQVGLMAGVIALAAPFGILLTLRFPVLPVVGFVVVSYFRLPELNPAWMGLKIPQLLALASLLVVAIDWLKGAHFQLPRGSGWLLMFFGLTSLGLLTATNVGLALESWSGNWIKVVLMTFVIAHVIRSRSEINLVAWLVILAGLTVACVALYNKAHGISLVEETRVSIGRAWGSMLGDPNDLALVLLFPLSFALARFERPGWARWIAAVATVAVLLGILATQSRGGLLGVIGVTGVFAVRRWGLGPRVLTGGAMMGLLLLTLAGIDGRQSGGATETGIDESAMGRIYAWQAAWNMAVDRPLTGVGLNNFYNNYYFYSPHWDGKNHAVHSTWFEVLAQTGFPGLIAFLCLYGTLVKAALSLERKVEAGQDQSPWPKAILAGLVGFGVGGTFLTQGFTWPLYIYAGLIWAYQSLDSPHSSEAQK